MKWLFGGLIRDSQSVTSTHRTDNTSETGRNKNTHDLEVSDEPHVKTPPRMTWFAFSVCFLIRFRNRTALFCTLIVFLHEICPYRLTHCVHFHQATEINKLLTIKTNVVFKYTNSKRPLADMNYRFNWFEWGFRRNRDYVMERFKVIKCWPWVAIKWIICRPAQRNPLRCVRNCEAQRSFVQLDIVDFTIFIVI